MQAPPQRNEDELREEEEFQLALALSQSEAEAKEKEKLKTTSILHKIEPARNRSPSPVEEPVTPELARYLNRRYWETRQTDVPSAEAIRPTSPSAPATAPLQNVERKSENGLGENEIDEFVKTLRTQVMIRF